MRNYRVVRDIAAERILILYRLAEERAKSNMDLSKGYVRTMIKISQHYNVGLPKRIDDRICKRCNVVLMPGLTASVRIASANGYVSYRCNSCGSERHVFYRKAARKGI